MKTRTVLALLAALATHVTAAHAQEAPPARGPTGAELNKLLDQLNTYPSILTYDRPEGQPQGRSLTVTVPSFPNGEIDAKYSFRGASTSPEVVWTHGPKGTKSYVLIFEDGTSNRNREGTLHWLAFNIPANVTDIAEGASVKGVGLKQPIGTMREGANIDNTVSYTGMGGSPTGNNYHMQVFALDTLLNLPSGATREQVWAAMNNHVLASGQSIGVLRAPPGAPPVDQAAAALQAANQAAVTLRVMMAPTLATIDRPQGQVRGTLTVASSSFSAYGPGGIIPKTLTGWGEAISPAVAWSPGPSGVKSYAVFFEDGTDNKDRDGLLYWLAFNIPASVRSLPEGLTSPQGAKKTIPGMKEAANLDGKPAYAGLRGYPGAPLFYYHLEVFALDNTLDLPSGASRAQVRAAMAGHVLARGQTAASYQPLGPGQAYLPPAPTKW